MSEAERSIRNAVRQNGYDIFEAEHARGVFNKFDVGCYGTLDEHEFTLCLRWMLGGETASCVPDKECKQTWKAADAQHVGEIDFEEFLRWYMNYFHGFNVQPGQHVSNYRGEDAEGGVAPPSSRVTSKRAQRPIASGRGGRSRVPELGGPMPR